MHNLYLYIYTHKQSDGKQGRLRESIVERVWDSCCVVNGGIEKDLVIGENYEERKQLVVEESYEQREAGVVMPVENLKRFQMETPQFSG